MASMASQVAPAPIRMLGQGFSRTFPATCEAVSPARFATLPATSAAPAAHSRATPMVLCAASMVVLPTFWATPRAPDIMPPA